MKPHSQKREHFDETTKQTHESIYAFPFAANDDIITCSYDPEVLGNVYVSLHNMRIVFSNTHYQQKVAHNSLLSVIPPLDLAYCASLLRQRNPDFEISILDANVLKLNESAQGIRLLAVRPNVAVFTAQTHSINSVKRLVNMLKKNNVMNILIGAHGSALPQQVLEEIEGLDVVVRGEPERVVAQVIEAAAQRVSLASIKGITYREQDRIIHVQDHPLLEDLDSLPYPARDLLPNDLYSSPYRRYVTALCTTRGCPGKCIFCDRGLLYLDKVRARTPKAILQEIEQCVQQFNTSYFAIIDQTFTVREDFVRDVCNRIIQSNLNRRIRWACNTRVDLLNNETLVLMKKAGCLQIGIGIESVQDRSLSILKKNITETQISDAISRIKRHGIVAMGYAIIGFPHQTKEDILYTKKKIFAFDPHALQLSFAAPLPGTQLYANCVKEDRILSDNWDDYVFLRKSIIRNDTLTTEDLTQLYHQILKQFYFRPRKFLKLAIFFFTRIRLDYLRHLKRTAKTYLKLS